MDQHLLKMQRTGPVEWIITCQCGDYTTGPQSSPAAALAAGNEHLAAAVPPPPPSEYADPEPDPED